MSQQEDLKKAKEEAMEMAEASREQNWERPSFAASLFEGNFRHDLIYPFPEQDPQDKEIGDKYIAQLETFAREKIDADAIDKNKKYPPELIEELKGQMAFGMKISKEYGGLGLSQTNYVRALEMLGGHCASTIGLLSAHQSIGVPQPLAMFGTPEQKKKFLPRLVNSVSAFALTEPGVGSDPAAMNTSATLSPDGETWIINGEKLWCTNGSIADIIVVMARTPDKMLRGKPRKQITAFLVEKDMPGFSVLHRCEFMGVKGFENASLQFNGVRVPKENIIGEIGGGLRLALATLNVGRLSIPGSCIGLGKKCLEFSRYWTNERIQWGKKIAHHEEIARYNGTLVAATYAMEALTYYTCSLVDKGEQDIRLEAAMAKLFCTELSWETTNNMVQVLGGRGYEQAQSLKARKEVPIPVERLLRDIRVNTILEGSTEIMHLFIAREALDMHMRLAMPILKPGPKLKQRFQALLKCISFYSIWYPKQWFYWAYWPCFFHMGKMGKYFRYVKATSHKLARTIFHQMLRYGANLENKQLILARTVEIGTELFAIATCASKASTLSKKDPNNKKAIEAAELFCRQSKRRIAGYFQEIRCNEDRLLMKVSKGVASGEYTWLEEGTIKNNVEYK